MPTDTPEQVVRAFFELFESGEEDRALALLDDDVEWRNTGLPTVRGRRVPATLKDMAGRGIGFSVRMHHIAADGDVVLTDRTDVLRVGPVETEFWVRGTFEVRDGRITLWDDRYAWGDVLLGAGRGVLRAIARR